MKETLPFYLMVYRRIFISVNHNHLSSDKQKKKDEKIMTTLNK
jgi:hypothetical protein